MNAFSVSITADRPQSAGAEPLTFDCPDLATALLVVDINVPDGGGAEVRRDGHLIVSVRKTGRAAQPVWAVNPVAQPA